MLIRELQEGEWPLWRQLAIAAATDSPESFRPTREENLARSDEEWIDIVDSTVRNPRGGLWIAEDIGEPVGMVFARIDEALTLAEFGAMWVAPESRSMGVGSALLVTVIGWADDLGADVVECWVSEGNESATAIYRKNGFKDAHGTQPLRDGSPVTVRKMQVRLNARP